MERVIHFEQFYYTNYGQGMRFEGDSTHNRQMEKNLELLAANWMKLDVPEPVESVVYNAHLHSYVAALTVPCTRAGDARSSYWIHAVLPEDREDDGFTECLSWPLERYQDQVLTNQELTKTNAQEVIRHPKAVCRKYDLTGDRLTQFMYMVWQTVCGQNKPSTLYFILDDAGAEDHNRTARDIMSLVYDILPEQRRHQADYQAWAESDIPYVRFAFKETTGSAWNFRLNPDSGGQDIGIPEEEREVLEILSALYEKNTEQYRVVVRDLYRDATESFEDLVWHYYLRCMNDGEELGMSQDALIRNQPYLEQRAEKSEDYRRLLCQCLNHIDTKEKPPKFIQTVMEKYILAAAGLLRADCPEYGASLTRNWQLLDQLRAGSIETARSYLEWIRKISLPYYRDFVKQGLSGGRGWILKALGNTEERQEWLRYCGNNKELQLRALTMMSYEELLKLDGESMDDAVQNLWLQTVAQRIVENSGIIGSANEAIILATFVVNLSSVMKLVLMKDEEGVNQRSQGPGADDLAVITAAIWQYEGQMDLSDRYTLCRIAKYTANADFEAMSHDFWTDVRPEDFEELNQLSSVSKVFESSSHPNYYNYRLYAGYKKNCRASYDGRWKKSDDKYFSHYTRLLHGAVRPAATAIWLYWLNHDKADTRLLYDVLTHMTEPENVHKLLEDYAVKGDVQAKRVEGFWENKRVKHPAKTRKKEKEQAADMDAVWSWAAAACIGLYMGLMVNGWYMTVHLSKILHQSALVWVGLIGIAVLTAVFIAFAEKLVSENVTVALYQIPWAGLCLFINLVLSYFIGNKITALISAIILVAVYTGMRIKKYL